MLTELFCIQVPGHASSIAPRCRGLAPSFGAGAADDQHPQGCLGRPQPRRLLAAAARVFDATVSSLSQLVPGERPGSGFAAGMQELVGVAHGHLRNALWPSRC
jgi:hypothetical protein